VLFHWHETQSTRTIPKNWVLQPFRKLTSSRLRLPVIIHFGLIRADFSMPPFTRKWLHENSIYSNEHAVPVALLQESPEDWPKPVVCQQSGNRRATTGPDSDADALPGNENYPVRIYLEAEGAFGEKAGKKEVQQGKYSERPSDYGNTDQLALHDEEGKQCAGPG
jgi:hypothetical protein